MEAETPGSPSQAGSWEAVGRQDARKVHSARVGGALSRETERDEKSSLGVFPRHDFAVAKETNEVLTALLSKPRQSEVEANRPKEQAA